MTDRLDTIRKRLASGSPFTAHAGDLAWALDQLERATKALGAAEETLVEHGIVDPRACLVYRAPVMSHEDEANAWRAWFNGGESEAATNARAEIARLDALSRATGEELRAESLDETENQA